LRRAGRSCVSGDSLHRHRLKIAVEVEVDVSRQAWQVRYADAIATGEVITIEGVRVPALSLKMLIKQMLPIASRIARIWCGCAT
jgi:hypothetical protein